MTYLSRSAAFRSLHHGPAILVVPNAWDAVSARLFEAAGFACVGTTSAGIAWSCGYPDGQKIPRDEMIAAIARVTRSTHLPVTADIEAGYGKSPEAVAETVRRVIGAGAVGVNLEDASADLGAGVWTTFRLVTFPQLRSALMAGGLLAFALSFDEIIVTTFTAGSGVTTLPIFILNNMFRPNQAPIVAVIAVVLVVVSIIPIYLAQRLAGSEQTHR